MNLFTRRADPDLIAAVKELAKATRQQGLDSIEAAHIVRGHRDPKPPKEPDPPPTPPEDVKFKAWVDRVSQSPEERTDLLGMYAKYMGRRGATAQERATIAIKLESRGAPLPAFNS